MKKKFDQEKFSKRLTDLNRNQLGSISLDDIDIVDKLEGAKRHAYLAHAESLWRNPVFANEIKVMVQAQLEFIGKECSEFSHMLVGRGTINGASILRERIQTLHAEFAELTKSVDKEFDPFAVSVGGDILDS